MTFGKKTLIWLLSFSLVGCATSTNKSSPTPVQIPSLAPSSQEEIFFNPESIAGCYELTLSKWRPDLHLKDNAIFITPLHRIELLAERGQRGWEKEGYIVRPAPGVPRSVYQGAYWNPKGPRTLEIVWTTGFSGLVMGLTIEENELHGQAGTFWDFSREQQRADVVARKIGCQSP